MAKPTKDAPGLIIIFGIIALIGILLGFAYNQAVYSLILLIPLVGYEIYRVEGKSTRWASAGLGGIIIAEIALIAFNVKFDLASFLDVKSKYFEGYEVPLGDIKILGPALMAILCIVLFKNTNGIYTKALSVLIFLAAFAVIYQLDPGIFSTFSRVMINSVQGIS